MLELRIGYGDHLAVADFLERDHEGMSAVVLDAHYANRRHAALIEVARRAGLEVLVDPLTERLLEPGFTSPVLESVRAAATAYKESPNNTRAAGLVESALAIQPDRATTVVAPNFLVATPDELERNLALARQTKAQVGDSKRVRAVLIVRSGLAGNPAVAEQIVSGYARSGIDEIDLRMTPLGGENERIPKIRIFYELGFKLEASGVAVIAGQQGAIGPTGLAVGACSSYSVGIGVRERVDFAAQMSAQRATMKSDRAKRGGVGGRVLLPGANVTVGTELARKLYEIPGTRTHLSCPHSDCASALDSPLRDYRRHYLHSRTAEIKELASMPSRWRGQQQRERIVRAIELRRLLNSALPAEYKPLPTRTAESLVSFLESDSAMLRTA